MANKSLFTSAGRHVPVADVVNEAGGKAYSFTDEHALAQLALTGTLHNTYYADANTQLGQIKELARQVSPEFLAKVAVYASEKGLMKDVPALLLAILSTRNVELFDKVFDRVVNNNVKVLRNFVQIIRSGQVGRKSLGSGPKRVVKRWLNNRSDDQLFRASIGNNPSLVDVIKLVHPKPKTESRNALYAYFLGKPFNEESLPQLVRDYEAFKVNVSRFKNGELTEFPTVPDRVPYEMVTSLELPDAGWKTLAHNATFQQTRQGLNAYLKHGVFNDTEMVKVVADRLSSEDQVAKSRVFPLQLMASYNNVDPSMPRQITGALQDALDLALSNIPELAGNVVVAVDSSGSMSSPITGHRGKASSKMRCVDAAALIASAILRRNPNTRVMVFDTKLHNTQLNERDSVITNAQKIAALGGGGTDCSIPLRQLNQEKAAVDFFVLVSDNESWADFHHGRRSYYSSGGTRMQEEWQTLKRRNPNAKAVLIDLQPYVSTQVQESRDVFNVGGLNDNVYTLMNLFQKGELDSGHLTGEIKKVTL